MTIEARVTVRGQTQVIRWSDGRVRAEPGTMRRLGRVPQVDLADPVGFLQAVRGAFGDDLMTHVVTEQADWMEQTKRAGASRSA